MTVIALWYEPHDNAAWIVADSRVSESSPTAGTITDSAAKIFSLPVNCFEPDHDGFFSRRTFTTSIGFAYAGSTLPATMTYAVSSSCLQNLIGQPESAPLRLIDAAQLVQRVANKYFLEMEKYFELAVVGWCPSEKKYCAYTLHPGGTPYGMQLAESPLYEPEHFTLLGSHQSHVRQKVKDVFQELNGRQLKRAPRLALQRLVEENNLKGIGGSLQMGIATQDGFALRWWCRPLNEGQPLAGRFLLGIDIEQEIGAVGNYEVGMGGIV